MNVKLFFKLIFVLCLIVVYIIWYQELSTFFTLENLKEHRSELLRMVNRHYISTILLYVLFYTIHTALSLPGAAVITIAGGFLFGVVPGIFLVNAAATGGAVLLFFIIRYFFLASFEQRYQATTSHLRSTIKLYGASYLLTLRLIPVIPFFVVTIGAALTPLSWRTFTWTTSVGIIPASLVFLMAGSRLASVDTLSHVFSWYTITIFCFLVFLSLTPVLFSRLGVK